MEELSLLEELYPFIIPKYREVHDIMSSLIDGNSKSELRIVDLGCGFGDLAQRIIDSFPQSTIFTIDREESILRRMREKRSGIADRLVLFHRDLNSDVWMNDIAQLNAVVSSFTLDYLTPQRRKEVVRECHGLLEPGGRWVSCEFYRAEDNKINRIFHDLEINFIQTALADGHITTEQIDLLSSSTILRQPHHVVSVDEMMEWMHVAGFRHIETPWRFLNLIVFSGVK
ncbi:MAG: methyltransferase domain-containing protein [Calditrichaeota bacterium]|nr:MAG: methyltransferase domain-containing protein [Calditrichota bacterium]